MGGLKIQFFARFQVWRSGENNPICVWGRRKTQQLLKLLSQERGRIFTQDELVDILFPNSDPQKSIQNLHGRISELRKTLEPELKSGNASKYVISAGKGLYYFTDSDECVLDTELFERLTADGDHAFENCEWPLAIEAYNGALSYTKGEYLQEDRYEDWTAQRRNQLNGLLIQMLERLSMAHSYRNQLKEAIDCCDRIHAIDPNHEQTFRQKMLLQHRLGEKAEAMATYRFCAERLFRNLNVKPARETESLYRQICNNGILIEDPKQMKISNGRALSEQSVNGNSSSNVDVLYKRGNYFLAKQSGFDALNAKKCFEEAISRDPQHAPSYEGLASAYFQLVWFHISPAKEVYPKAKKAVTMALRLDDQLSHAYVSRGYMKMNYEWDGESAYQDFLVALELDPKNFLAHRCIAGLHAVRANFPEAIENIERAYILNPVSFSILIPRAWIFYLAGEYDKAVRACEEIIEMDPSLSRARTLLGLSLEQLKDYDRAISELRKAVKLSRGNLIQVCDLAHLYGRIGEHERAEKLLASSQNEPDSSSNEYYRALIYTGLDQVDRAVQSLRTSWDARSWKSIFARTDPRFQRLNTYDPYQKLSDEIWSY